ncbi:aarF domain-containing protein kinase 1 isoform X2 [Gracilinanus agilis]|uniref:aarF domain-containing protein kinase 1 isoform X2 n=1 Tax=Gracilinanus agilis TaxID=191870 RepID=UPI001CFDFEDC|nr:aarF domain-containing protein kinase 1 isoform X2 [Gracilinanus agilis]
MANSVVKIISWTSMAVASSAFYFCTNKYLDPSDFGAIRFGRAVATTAVISYDYYTSLRKVPQDPEEYAEIKSKMLVSAVKYLFPEFELAWLVDEAKKNLILELDFLNEGRNAEKVAEMLKNVEALKIPKIYWELSTRRVLLMEFLEGGQINDKEYIMKNRIDVNEVSQLLGTMYSEMIFVHGFVHCDPHPGNLLVRKNATTRREEIILLDHGQYQVLTEEFRLNYCHLWQALINVDMENVKLYSQLLGAGDLYPLFACMLTARTWNSVTKGISQAPITSSENRELQKNVATYLPQISQLLNKVPRQTLLILKTNDLLRGIETTLCTRASASSFLIMSRCCTRALAEHRRKNTCSLLKKTQISVGESFCLWQINLHELFLRVRWSWLGNWVSTYLFWKSSSD